MANSTTNNAQKRIHTTTGMAISISGFILMLTLFLIAHFVLGEWAEQNELQHSLQHALIFIAGAGSGVATVGVFKSKKSEK